MRYAEQDMSRGGQRRRRVAWLAIWTNPPEIDLLLPLATEDVRDTAV